MFFPVLLSVLLPVETGEVPVATDPRLVVELVAREPAIVHPIAMTFDTNGRLLVIESHTHFRPKNYQGPPHDRIRFLEDSDGDGELDRWGTFFEGTTHTMDIATHPSGAIYVATRNRILRLWDLDGDGRADRVERIVTLDTPGNYPHNGLSGLCFDQNGDLYFGLGENLGEPYTLIGSDGSRWSGGGEGGSIFWCTADGARLRRIATGFWNPFGIELDVFGRLFAIDNDPDSSPPCRLLDVVHGGDYGYQYRYGRSGRHPFQSWNGRLPGTLPMVTGTGEAPCELIFYDAPGLPPEYRGKLLVTAWADHQLQVIEIEPRGATYTGTARPLVRGPVDFRPVGLAVAPDGSLYISDWVRRDYELHGRGAIWHIRAVRRAENVSGGDPLVAPDRRLREAAARKAAPETLAKLFDHPDALVRATALGELIRRKAINEDLLRQVADDDPCIALRAMAVRGLVTLGYKVRGFLRPDTPPLLAREAIAGLSTAGDASLLERFLSSPDPFLQHAARQQFITHPQLVLPKPDGSPRRRIQRLLILRGRAPKDRGRHLPDFLGDTDPTVRLLALKWISDEKLTQYADLVAKALERPDMTVQLYVAATTALARLHNRPFDEKSLQRELLRLALNPDADLRQRILALRGVRPQHPGLNRKVFQRLLQSDVAAMRLEAVRSLRLWGSRERFPLLRRIALDRTIDSELRAEAVLGLAARAASYRRELLDLAADEGNSQDLRFEALRALTGTNLTANEAKLVEACATTPLLKDAAARTLGRWVPRRRPPKNNLTEWEAWLEGPFSARRGERLFFNPAVGGCYRCHRFHGRGAAYGPDLSQIGLAGRRHILEALLQPSANVAPAYQPWLVALRTGQIRTGLLVRTHLDEYTFVDSEGITFTARGGDIDAMRLSSGSIMPEDIADRLLDQELRDLVGWLSEAGIGSGQAVTSSRAR